MYLKTNIAIFILLISCSSVINKKDSINNSIKAIRISQSFPQIDAKGKLMGYDTSFANIYYYKNQVLYRDLYLLNSMDYYPDADSISVVMKKRESFLVHTAGKKYGLFFDKQKGLSDKEVATDSMLQIQWYNSARFGAISLSKLTEKFNADSGILYRTYAFKGTSDTLLKGTVSLWYSNKLNWVNYSLLKDVDTVSKMKLYRCTILNEAKRFKENNFSLDAVEQSYELKEVTVTDPAELMYYFDREKKLQQH